MFDSEKRCWDEQRMDAIDPKLRGCFPELIGPQEAVGTVRAEVARQLGLPPGVLVSAGEPGRPAIACLSRAGL